MSTNSSTYNKQWYLKNREKRIAQIRASEKKREGLYREWLMQYLATHPCVDCGETDIVVLEFDHLGKEPKLDDVAHMVPRGYSLDKIKKEISKCEVVCCNCHRRRTYKRANSYRLHSSFRRAGVL